MKKIFTLFSAALLLFLCTVPVYSAQTEVSGKAVEQKTASDIAYTVTFSAPAAKDTELIRRETYEKLTKQLTDAQMESREELAFLLYPVEAVLEVVLPDGSAVGIKSVSVTDERAEFTLFGDLLPALIKSGAYPGTLQNGFAFTLRVRVAVNINGTLSNGEQLGAATLGAFSVPATSCIEYDLPAGTDNKNNPVFLFYPFEKDIPLNNPTRPGYTFTGWVSDGKAVDRIPNGIRLMQITAGWKEKIFQARYVLTTRPGYDFIKCRHNNPQEFSGAEGFALQDAQPPSGWVFRGWYLSPDFSGEPVTEIPAFCEKDVILYARWQTEDEADDEKIAAGKWGDLDSDGKITAADARIALRAAVELEKPGKEIIRRGDFAGQGRLSATAARHLLRVAVGLDSIKDVLKLYGIL